MIKIFEISPPAEADLVVDGERVLFLSHLLVGKGSHLCYMGFSTASVDLFWVQHLEECKLHIGVDRWLHLIKIKICLIINLPACTP